MKWIHLIISQDRYHFIPILKKFEEKIEQAAQILKELPPEILEGEEDLKRVYMGYMR